MSPRDKGPTRASGGRAGADSMFRHEQMRIAGEKVGGERSGERTIEVFNPYTNQRIGSVPKATVEEVRRAFAIARGYRAKLTRFERANVLNKRSEEHTSELQSPC